jgi:transglutaminase-like putative cysteine protease
MNEGNILSIKLQTETQNIDEYLPFTDVIDYNNPVLVDFADNTFKDIDNELDLIDTIFKYVRDNIAHSVDSNIDDVTCSASEVFERKHGNCCGKAHLLAALLRYYQIPVGFCYQRVSAGNNMLGIHGLNAIYVSSIKKWVRVDSRGNKPGVNAEFDIEQEKLAFYMDPDKGEYDDPVIYINPKKKVVEALSISTNRNEVHENWMKMWIPVNKQNTGS